MDLIRQLENKIKTKIMEINTIIRLIYRHISKPVVRLMPRYSPRSYAKPETGVRASGISLCCKERYQQRSKQAVRKAAKQGSIQTGRQAQK